MPADCDLDFEWARHPSHQPLQEKKKKKKTTSSVKVSLAVSTDDCTGIRTGNDVIFRERESANDTHKSTKRKVKTASFENICRIR